MKNFFIAFFIVFFVASCNTDRTSSNLELENLYNKYGVEGCFLLKSLNNEQTYTYNQNRCEQGFLPASTFKIVNSLIALETGVAGNENMLMKWDSVQRQFSAWNKDHTLQSAFKVSCVPCFQNLAVKIGVENMKLWTNKLNFGKMDVHPDNLTDFWLKGNSEISPFQQLNFLEKLENAELPVKPSTVHRVRNIMKIAVDSSGLIMRGKTGWAIVGQRSIGWFVGSIERPDGERFIFVNNIEAKLGAIPDKDFMMIRKSIVYEVLKSMQVL